MVAVSVCGFAQQKISVRRSFGVLQDGLIVTAQSSGKNHQRFLSVFRDGQFEPRRSEDVSRVMRLHRKLWADLEGIGARNLLETRERFLRLGHGVKRQRWLVAAVAFLGRVLRVFFLLLGRMREQQLAMY